ncbi:iron chelate uptake ABC transporter family permease subunit [Methanosarcina barkeri]|uniref:iron chelate uptake ABC transporter family permease subunit n=1 Tax=Methanosarcina barkeri TaxID=2208 RepID=UPI000AE3FD98|nr:iron chelate uptake ABC transporter family permease subunit [Methanosarcina barkeri]
MSVSGTSVSSYFHGGLFAGIALRTAGAAMQGALKNPLADPYMLGIASAAGFGAAIAIVFGTGILPANISSSEMLFFLTDSFSGHYCHC